jgi:DNA-binding MarR family transcriptional regulator
VIAAPAATSFGSLLTKTKWLYDAHFNRLLKEADIDVTPEQFAVLITVHANTGVSQNEIARRGYKDKTNVARIIDGLEKRGLLARRSDAADRRAFRVELTAGGQELMLQLFPLVARLNEAATKGLSAPESELMLGFLARIMTDLKSA